MIDVKRTSIKLPKEMLIKIKAIAVEEETTQNKVITDLIEKGLKATKKQGKIKAKKIQMPFNNPDKKGSIKDSIGIVEIDNPENLDVNELIDSIHTKKDLY